MRHLIFLIPFLFHTSLTAQEISEAEAAGYIDQLIAKEVLKPAAKEIFLKQVASKSIQLSHQSTVSSTSYTYDELTKEAVLQFCWDAFASAQEVRVFHGNGKVEKRIKGEDSFTRSRIFRIDITALPRLHADYIHSKRSTIGLTRTRTLQDFKAAGLIDDLVFNKCQESLESGTIRDEPDLLAFMIESAMYYRTYDFDKKEQEEYIDGLTKMGLLTVERQKELLNSYGKYELKTIPEILQYSHRYVLVDVSNFEPNPQLIYPLVFENIKKLVPGFNYSDLTITIQEELDYGLIRQDCLLSFTIDGTAYRHICFHDYRKTQPEPDDEDIPSMIGEDFHKGVNKWLTDIESPYRLYTIRISERAEKIGLLLLKENEAGMITDDSYLISQENFDSRLSKKNINKLIAQLQENGFFKHLTKEEIDSAVQNIASADIQSIESLLLQFPKTVVFFDWEAANLNTPYKELTEKFALATRGAVTVTAIIDNFAKGFKKAKNIKYGFTMNGKTYETMLPFNRDWLDPAFMELFKKALQENKVDGALYQCISNGQESGYIFLDSKQHAFIEKHYPDILKGAFE